MAPAQPQQPYASPQAQYQATSWHVELARCWTAIVNVEDPAARIAFTRLLGLVAALGGTPVHYGAPPPTPAPALASRTVPFARPPSR